MPTSSFAPACTVASTPHKWPEPHWQLCHVIAVCALWLIAAGAGACIKGLCRYRHSPSALFVMLNGIVNVAQIEYYVDGSSQA